MVKIQTLHRRTTIEDSTISNLEPRFTIMFSKYLRVLLSTDNFFYPGTGFPPQIKRTASQDFFFNFSKKKIIVSTPQDTIFTNPQSSNLREPFCNDLEISLMQSCLKLKNNTTSDASLCRNSHAPSRCSLNRRQENLGSAAMRKSSTSGLGHSGLVRGNFGMVMLWDRVFQAFLITFHCKNHT